MFLKETSVAVCDGNNCENFNQNWLIVPETEFSLSSHDINGKMRLVGRLTNQKLEWYVA